MIQKLTVIGIICFFIAFADSANQGGIGSFGDLRWWWGKPAVIVFLLCLAYPFVIFIKSLIKRK